jgi:hypothetical protein
MKVAKVCRDEGAGRFCMRGTVATKPITVCAYISPNVHDLFCTAGPLMMIGAYLHMCLHRSRRSSWQRCRPATMWCCHRCCDALTAGVFMRLAGPALLLCSNPRLY